MEGTRETQEPFQKQNRRSGSGGGDGSQRERRRLPGLWLRWMVTLTEHPETEGEFAGRI